MKSRKRLRAPSSRDKLEGITADVSTSPAVAAVEKPTQETTSAGFWERISAAKLVLGGLGITAAGIFAYFTPFIDPLKNTVLHYIYSEKASITLSCDPCTVSKGEATRVSVEVAPSPSVDIAEGVLKLQFNERELTLSEETAASFETNVITAKRLLNKSFVLYPTSNVESAATSVVTVTLQTKFGNHVSGPMRILVVPPKSDSHGPYIEPSGKHRVVLTGEWRLAMGGSLGGMRIKQNENDDISGVYWLNEPTGRTEAEVAGYKDGTSFKVFFMRPQKKSRWRVDANFYTNEVDKGFIEMKGCAFSLRPDPTVATDSATSIVGCATRNYVGWRGDGGTIFWSSAKLR